MIEKIFLGDKDPQNKAYVYTTEYCNNHFLTGATDLTPYYTSSQTDANFLSALTYKQNISGTTGYIPIFNSNSSLTNSNLYQATPIATTNTFATTNPFGHAYGTDCSVGQLYPIVVTSNMSYIVSPPTYAGPENLVDLTTLNHYYSPTSAGIGSYITFDFGGVAGTYKRIITAVSLQANDTQAHFKWRGSNNNSTWIDISVDFILHPGSSGGYLNCGNLSANTTEYRYYQLYQTDVNAIGVLYDIIFTIDSATLTQTYAVGFNGITTPTAQLHLGAGNQYVNGASLKLSSGSTTIVAEKGAIEYDGTNLYFTPLATRYSVSLSNHSHSLLQGNVTINGNLIVTATTYSNNSYLTTGTLTDAPLYFVNYNPSFGTGTLQRLPLLLTTPVVGSMEWDMNNLYFTQENRIYPPAFNSTYIKAQSYGGYYPYLIMDPLCSYYFKWLVGDIANSNIKQHFNIDLGRNIYISKFYLQAFGGLAVYLPHNFSLYGSNTVADFNDYTSTAITSSSVTMLYSGVTTNNGNVQSFTLVSPTNFRYLIFFFDDCWGGVRIGLNYLALESPNTLNTTLTRTRIITDDGNQLTNNHIPISTYQGRLIDGPKMNGNDFLIPPTTITGNITATTQNIIIAASGATITLPTASGNSGLQYNFVKTCSGINDVIINPILGQTINGSTQLILNFQWTSVVIISDGSNWIRIS